MKHALGVSMKHVARAAKVSVMTVSLALRHDPRIPAATRSRVLKAAQRIGYRKNPLVTAHMASLRGRHPRGQEAHVIAYVEPTAWASLAQSRFTLVRFARGAAESAAVNGYRLERFLLGDGALSEARLLQVLAARGIRGVVFAPFLEPSACLHESWEQHALATIGYSLAQPRLHRALNHHAHSVRQAAAQLAALGYRRVGLVLNPNEDARTEQGWLSAFLTLRHQCRRARATFPLLVADGDGEIADWLRREKPDCVISPHGSLFALVRAYQRETGRATGFASLHLNASCAGCSGIDQNNEQVGAAAVELVIAQLHTNTYGVPADPKTVLIEGRWIGGSSAPAVGSASFR